MSIRSAFVLNYPSHYREAIYKKINDEVEADFYFGDIPGSTIKKFNLTRLTHFKGTFKTIKFKSFFWFRGSIRLVFGSYKKLILTGDPQILSNWVILLLAKLFGKKTFLWTHGWYGREKGGIKLIKKIYLSLASGLLLYGDYAKQLLQKEGFPDEKLIPIYNSLNYDRQLLIRNNLKATTIYVDHFKNNNPVLIYIGRIQKIKRLNLLLESINKLNNKGVFVNLVIVGGKSDGFEDLEEDISKYKLESQVWVYGPSYDEEINGVLLYNANICVSPGNVGLSAVHSLMFGTPVITHNHFSEQMPEFETVIDGVTGVFFQENNVDDLADKIELLIKNKIEKKNCFKVIDDKWNPDAQIKIIKKILDD